MTNETGMYAIEDLLGGNTIPNLSPGVKAVFSELDLANTVVETLNMEYGSVRFAVVEVEVWKTEVIRHLLDKSIPF